MATAISQAVNTLSRSFSRQGVTVLRAVPEEMAQGQSRVKNIGDDAIFKSAVLAALLGVSFSMFGISQLQDNPHHSRIARIGTLKWGPYN